MSLNPVSTRHRFDIHTTSITLKRRRTDVKTTSCAYWETTNFTIINRMVGPETEFLLVVD